MTLFLRTQEGMEAVQSDFVIRAMWEENGLRSKPMRRQIIQDVYSTCLRDDPDSEFFSTTQYYVRTARVCKEAVGHPAMHALSAAANSQLLEMEVSRQHMHEYISEMRAFRDLAQGESPVEMLWDELLATESICREVADRLVPLLTSVMGVRQRSAKTLAQATVGTAMIFNNELCGMHDDCTKRTGMEYLSNIEGIFAVIRRSTAHLLLRQVLQRTGISSAEVGAELRGFSKKYIRSPDMRMNQEQQQQVKDRMGNEVFAQVESIVTTSGAAQGIHEYAEKLQADAGELATVLRHEGLLHEAGAFAANGAFAEPHDKAYAVPWSPVAYDMRAEEQAAGIRTSGQEHAGRLRLQSAAGKSVEFVVTGERVALSPGTLLAPVGEESAKPLRRADASLRQRLAALWERYPDIINLAETVQPFHVSETPEEIHVCLPETAVSGLSGALRSMLLSSESAANKNIVFPVGTSACLCIAKQERKVQTEAVSASTHVQPEYLIRDLLNRRGRLDTPTFVKLLGHLGVECNAHRGKGGHESYESNGGHRANLSGELLVHSYKWSPDRLIHKLRELHVPPALFYNVLRVHYKE